LVGKLIVKIQKLFSLERKAIILCNMSFTFLRRVFFWFAWFVVLTAWVNIFSRRVHVKKNFKKELLKDDFESECEVVIALNVKTVVFWDLTT